RGEPTGVLKDNATNRVDALIPPLTDAYAERLVRQGIEHGLSKGVSQVHNTEVDWSVQDSARRLRRNNGLDMRFYSFVPLADWERMAGLVAAEGRGDDWLRWGALKCVSDG